MTTVKVSGRFHRSVVPKIFPSKLILFNPHSFPYELIFCLRYKTFQKFWDHCSMPRCYLFACDTSVIISIPWGVSPRATKSGSIFDEVSGLLAKSPAKFLGHLTVTAARMPYFCSIKVAFSRSLCPMHFPPELLYSYQLPLISIPPLIPKLLFRAALNNICLESILDFWAKCTSCRRVWSWHCFGGT